MIILIYLLNNICLINILIDQTQNVCRYKLIGYFLNFFFSLHGSKNTQDFILDSLLKGASLLEPCENVIMYIWLISESSYNLTKYCIT